MKSRRCWNRKVPLLRQVQGTVAACHYVEPGTQEHAPELLLQAVSVCGAVVHVKRIRFRGVATPSKRARRARSVALQKSRLHPLQRPAVAKGDVAIREDWREQSSERQRGRGHRMHCGGNAAVAH